MQEPEPQKQPTKTWISVLWFVLLILGVIAVFFIVDYLFSFTK